MRSIVEPVDVPNIVKRLESLTRALRELLIVSTTVLILANDIM